jgi:hypothetical protein
VLSYDSNKPLQIQIDFFDHACRSTNHFENELWKAFDSIEAILIETEEPLDEYLWSDP